jgi:hypothetical protein
MTTIDLGEVLKIASVDQFWAFRGKAIQAYANLEQGLAHLFSILSGTPMEVAAIIFFKISSADARNKILEKLFKRKFQTQYNLFRNSFFDQLRPIDLERNEIVHWNTVHQTNIEGEKAVVKLLLMPPATWNYDITSPSKDTDSLITFIAKCDFYSRLCSMFIVMIGNITTVPIPEADKKPWLEIFSRPITYPPPTDHPLSPTPQEHDNPSQSFRV